MRNVTISMDEQLLQEARVAAARAGLSVSRYLAEATVEKLRKDGMRDEQEQRRLHLEALRRAFAEPKMRISENGRMPNADDRNARR